jgi:hypothetical protein
LAQTFFIDSAVVQGAPAISVSAVDLYFQAKPDRTNNYSGILNPGVSVFIAETSYSVPIIAPKYYQIGRLEYDQIATSSDASIPSRLRFPTPVGVTTDTEYALIIIFDGSENFQLWTSVIGEFLINSKKISPGPTGKYIGNYFSFNNTAAQAAAASAALQNYQSFWTPLNGTDLKFKVYCARYATGGFPIASNASINATTQIIRSQLIQHSDTDSVQYIYPATNMEYIIFDQSTSVKERFVGGQHAYQNTFNYPGGYANGSSYVTISVAGGTRVTANTNLPNGQPFSWNTVFGSYAGDKYIVLHSGNTVTNIRQVNTIVSNTIIELTEPASFVNSAACFKITPVGQVDSFNKSSPFGHFESIMMLTHSSANSTVRFVNNTIESVTVTTGGTGYSNSNVLYITGFESVASKVSGGYIAVGNIVTDGVGAIINVYFSNAGCGFVYSTNVKTIITTSANTTPTVNTAVGSGAVFSYSIGATIKTDQRPNIFRKCRIVDFDIADVIPYFDFNQPGGTSVALTFHTNYYTINDTSTFNNTVSYVDDMAVQDEVDLKLFQKNSLLSPRVKVYPSRSNEFGIKYANGAPNNIVSSDNTSNAIIMIADCKSNNDFICVSVNSTPTMSMGKYIINNDYTGEETDAGNAYARQITTRIPFSRLAEDLIVYTSAYKTTVNDIQVYARMYNSADPEYFEDKDWTRLQQNFGAKLVSSMTNSLDWVELSFGLQNYPNTDFTSTGTASMTLSSNVVTGQGTTFTSDFIVGDLVKISNPLFDQTYLIDVVGTVTNNTSMTLNNPVSNSNMSSSGFNIERIRNYKYQTFLNVNRANTSRYYNNAMAPFDGYDTVQIKVIMLSSRTNLVPRVDDIRAIGVSA